jgi:hypothetical protein
MKKKKNKKGADAYKKSTKITTKIKLIACVFCLSNVKITKQKSISFIAALCVATTQNSAYFYTDLNDMTSERWLFGFSAFLARKICFYTSLGFYGN